jgi:hypothetical protein
MGCKLGATFALRNRREYNVTEAWTYEKQNDANGLHCEMHVTPMLVQDPRTRFES